MKANPPGTSVRRRSSTEFRMDRGGWEEGKTLVGLNIRSFLREFVLFRL